jgi:hypothetical protein
VDENYIGFSARRGNSRMAIPEQGLNRRGAEAQRKSTDVEPDMSQIDADENQKIAFHNLSEHLRHLRIGVHAPRLFASAVQFSPWCC